MAQRLRDFDFCNGWVFYGIECSWQEGAGPEPGTHNLTSTHQQKGIVVSHRRYKQKKTTKLRIYIAHQQGAILCYVFLYVFFFFPLSLCFDLYLHFIFILAITKDVNTTLESHCKKEKTKKLQKKVNLTAPSHCHVSGNEKKQKKKLRDNV